VLLVPLLLAGAPRILEATEDTEPPRVTLGPRARDLKVGPGMNAAGRCLTGCEFVGQNLSGAVFDGGHLPGAVFYQCDLTRASFKETDLRGMNITDCCIEGADFTDAMINGIAGMSGGLTRPSHAGWPHDMHLSEQQLMSTRSYKTKDLSRCVISLSERREPTAPRFDFRGANLEGACLHRGDFSKCDFTDARIDGIDVLVSTITFDQLASTDNLKNKRSLRGARFSTIPFTGKWDLSGMDLTGTREFPSFSFKNDDIDFSDAVITQCMFGGTITKAQLRCTRSFKEGDLRCIKFYQIDFSRFDFSGVNLTGSEFYGCGFSDARFDDAVINNVHFAEDQPSGSAGITVPQIKSTWNYRHGHMQGIRLPDNVAKALTER
jgi:uncharacterized protein YjbI with pentapeptide repeats